MSILSRLLSVAASATAASLIGQHDQHSNSNYASQVGSMFVSLGSGSEGDNEGMSFNAFLEALENGRLASALHGETDDIEDINIALNFFRIFRFNTPVDATNALVPVLIVGIRTVAAQDAVDFAEGGSIWFNMNEPQRRASMSAGSTRPNVTTRSALRRNAESASQIPTQSSPPPNTNTPPIDPMSRSWIIYVLGGSYPENHPILTTPSLFTDSPTYEDMVRLTAIFGPQKPAVATTEEVAASGGLFAYDESAAAAIGERCLICLADYAKGDEMRKIGGCEHTYHKACIDEVC